MAKGLTGILGISALLFLSAAVTQAERVVFESETAELIEAPMVRVNAEDPPVGRPFISGASADAYLQIPEGSGNPPKVTAGQATYTVEIDQGGLYVLWCRVYWEDECGNSLTVRIDDGPEFAIGQNAVYKRWHWVRSPPRLPLLRLQPGTYRLRLRNREDGVAVDQIVLSNERRFMPMGIQPVSEDEE